MNHPLFTGERVRLVAQEIETTAPVIAHFSRDSELMRLQDSMPAIPLLASRIRENNENIDSRGMVFGFNILALPDDRLVGMIDLSLTQWHHGDAFIGIAIVDRADWGKGYGTDALCVLERYAFTELNLHRLTLNVFEYNPRAIRSYQKAGFRYEGRMRQCLHREGRRWDLIYMGILREEWQAGVHLSHGE